MMTKEKIDEAYKNIKRDISVTDLLKAHKISKKVGGTIYLKLENLQLSGSFKVRGAANKIKSLTEEEKAKGIVASSAGNHAQGVALAAKNLGISATIVMPETAPLAKIAATKEYGADVILYGKVFDDAMEKAKEIRDKTGKILIHAYDDEKIIAGQGTVAIEMLKAAKKKWIDQIIVPVGGGGLIAGIATYIKAVRPGIEIIGVQTESATGMKTSLELGKNTPVTPKASIADGIAVGHPGKLTFAEVQKHVSKIVSVSEDDISKAVLFLLEKCKVIVEGAGAVAVAAIMNGSIDVKDKTTIGVLSGGNIDVTLMEDIIDRALVLEGRRQELRFNIKDEPMELVNLLTLLSEQQAHIHAIRQSKSREHLKAKYQGLNIVIDTRGPIHLSVIYKKLKEKGYEIL